MSQTPDARMNLRDALDFDANDNAVSVLAIRQGRSHTGEGFFLLWRHELAFLCPHLRNRSPVCVQTPALLRHAY